MAVVPVVIDSGSSVSAAFESVEVVLSVIGPLAAVLVVLLATG